MQDAIDRLLTLRVSDVMAKGLIVLEDRQTLTEAAEVFARDGITSAPVMNAEGKCVGMLSAADFAGHWPAADGTQEQQKGGAGGESEESTSASLVADCMSREVATVAPDQSLLSVARLMCSDHFHRLPVFRDGRPIGVVSTMDVVAAMVNAIDEMTVGAPPAETKRADPHQAAEH